MASVEKVCPAPDTGAASNGEFVNEVVERGVKSDVENGEESGERRQRLNNGGFISGGGGRKRTYRRRFTIKDLVYEMQMNPAAMDTIDNNANIDYNIIDIHSDTYDNYPPIVYVERCGCNKRSNNGNNREAIIRNSGINGEWSDESGGDIEADRYCDDGSCIKRENIRVDRRRGSFLPFAEAREIMKTLCLKSRKEWQKWSKSKHRPKGIPSHPDQVYKQDWQGWGNWIGTGRIANMDRVYLSFTDARERVRALNLKGWKEYEAWRKSGNRPLDIPSAPDQVYRRDWRGWGDWIGTGVTQDRGFLSFTDARTLVRGLKFEGWQEWHEWAKSKQRPSCIPPAPDRTYGREWQGWGDWVGSGNIAREDRVFLCFTDAREIVRSLKLKSVKEWRNWSKSEHRPPNIPFHPHSVYGKEWEGYGDWIGTGSLAPQDRVYLSFIDAREFVRRLNLKSRSEWQEWSKSKHRPLNIPLDPDKIYKGREWRGWADWIGKRSVSPMEVNV